MNLWRSEWTIIRAGLVVALLLVIASGLLYPGGTLRDESTLGYSLTRNFLSDLGAAEAFNYQRNTIGALLFGGSVFIGVLVLAGSLVAMVRLLSAGPRARLFARAAAGVGVLACVGFLGTAIAPVDRAWHLHTLSGMVGFRSFPVMTALLAIATARDRRFRTRASVGWTVLTVVVAGLITASILGPSTDTDRGLEAQVLMQKVLVGSILAVIWFESHEGEIASGSGIALPGSGEHLAAG